MIDKKKTFESLRVGDLVWVNLNLDYYMPDFLKRCRAKKNMLNGSFIVLGEWHARNANYIRDWYAYSIKEKWFYCKNVQGFHLVINGKDMKRVK
jgi:hypothetical protein